MKRGAGMITVGDVMKYCRNYFEVGYLQGEFEIADGVISPAPSAPYICIEGSMYNDGVHKDGDIFDPFGEQVFSGRIWLLSPPKGFILLCDQITVYAKNNPDSGVISQSFGGYSYTKATDGGKVAGWQSVYRDRLQPYQRMFTEVRS